MNACRLTLRPPHLGRLLAAALTAVMLLLIAACTTAPLPDVPKNVSPKCVGVPIAGFTWITLHVEGSEGAAGAQVTVTATSKTPGFDPDALPHGITYSLPYCKAIHYKPGVVVRIIIEATLVKSKPGDKPIFSCNVKNQLGKVVETGGPVSRGTVTCNYTTSAADIVEF